tara:strand:- start:368 stop:727 length:360 start_codon:yes stop_codon:yes gene_type:complete
MLYKLIAAFLFLGKSSGNNENAIGFCGPLPMAKTILAMTNSANVFAFAVMTVPAVQIADPAASKFFLSILSATIPINGKHKLYTTVNKVVNNAPCPSDKSKSPPIAGNNADTKNVLAAQ